MHRLSRGGGIPVVVRDLASHVVPSDVELHVITVRPEVADDRLGEVAATIHTLDYVGSYRNPAVRARLILQVSSTLKALSPDVVHVHSGTTWLALGHRLRHPRFPYVLEVHDAPGSGRHGRWTDRVDGWWVRHTNTTALVHSSQVREAVVSRWTEDPSRIAFIPLGVNIDRFATFAARRAVDRAARGWGSSAVVLVAVGRPARSKRFDLLIDATAEVRAQGVDARLVLVGPDPGWTEVRSRVEAHGLENHVDVTGPLFADDLAAVLCSADILCSTSEYEGFGLTLIEGMACGLPVVAMSVGGVTDIVVEGVTGHLVAPGDLAAFSSRVRELAADPRRRAQMGAAGASRVRELFGVADFAARVSKLYEELAR